MGTSKTGNYRWVICALLFFATTLNYLDRTIIGLLKDDIGAQFGWSESDYSNIVVCFQVAYALGLLGAGWLVDRLGTKLGYFLSVCVWSIATILHGFARGTFGFAAARSLLGLSEAGNFPAANKTVAEWFPLKERALATGIYNSGSNIGAIVAPVLIPWLLINYGWQAAFYATGALGLIWLVLWVLCYGKPSEKKISQAELDYINSDNTVPDTSPAADDSAAAEDDGRKYSWARLLKQKGTWAFVVGKLFSDPVWWFFLFWLPSFLKAEYGLEGMDISMPLIVVYTFSSVGSILGGWLPKFLINRGMDPKRARSRSMLVYAILPLAVLFTQSAGSADMWFAVLIIGVACAAHCAWMANLFATVSDNFPKKAVASVTGIGGMAGSIGGIVVAKLAGILFDRFKLLGDIGTGYAIMFAICAVSYLVAWLIMAALGKKKA